MRDRGAVLRGDLLGEIAADPRARPSLHWNAPWIVRSYSASDDPVLGACDVEVAAETATIEDRRRDRRAGVPREPVEADERVQRARTPTPSAPVSEIDREERRTRGTDARLGAAQMLLGREHVGTREQQLRRESRPRAASCRSAASGEAVQGSGTGDRPADEHEEQVVHLHLRHAAARRQRRLRLREQRLRLMRRSSAEVSPARWRTCAMRTPSRRLCTVVSASRICSAVSIDARYVAATSLGSSESRNARCACTVARYSARAASVRSRTRPQKSSSNCDAATLTDARSIVHSPAPGIPDAAAPLWLRVAPALTTGVGIPIGALDAVEARAPPRCVPTGDGEIAVVHERRGDERVETWIAKEVAPPDVGRARARRPLRRQRRIVQRRRRQRRLRVRRREVARREGEQQRRRKGRPRSPQNVRHACAASGPAPGA